MPKPWRDRGPAPYHAGAPPDARQLGLQAFQQDRFDEAIQFWKTVDPRDDAVRAALAEAYFRRALKTINQDSIADLKQAVALAPTDMRYMYHLAMHLHRNNDASAANRYYLKVVRGGGPPGAALLLSLTHAELAPGYSLAGLPGNTPEMRAAFAPLQELLISEPPSDVTSKNFVLPRRDGYAAAAGLARDDPPAPNAPAVPEGAPRGYYRCGAHHDRPHPHRLARALRQGGAVDRAWPAPSDRGSDCAGGAARYAGRVRRL